MTDETIKNTRDAGRVRARLIDDLNNFGSSLCSELEVYSDCFTDNEVKALRQLVSALNIMKGAIDTLEDRRLAKPSSGG